MSRQKILIAGGGISGLTAAFELSEDRGLDITVLEAASECGGKMRGRYNPETGRFEEHSIRALSPTYFSLFDIFYRAGILDYLSPVKEYMFYEKASGKHVAVSRQSPIDIKTVLELIETFDLSKKDMLHLMRKIVHHVNATEAERERMVHQRAGDVIGVDDFDPPTRQFINNWFGILTGARMHSKAVDIMDSFLLMFMPTTESPHLPQGVSAKSYCFNRPTSEAIDALVSMLRERGVKFVLNTRLSSIEESDGKVRIETDNDELKQGEFDAAIMAVPHEVMWMHGLIDAAKPFSDEWSFGSQYPLRELPEVFKPFAGRSYNLCFDAPWNIVFQIQHRGSFWKDVDFPEGYPYNLSATCSSPHNLGSLYGKRFGECSPEEALHEILFQLGITDADERASLVANATVDPVYLEYTAAWRGKADVPTVEMGPIHDDHRRWVDHSQIYVRSAEDPEIGPESKLAGVFLAGEVVTVPGHWKIPTMEQTAMSGKQAAQLTFDYLGRDRKVNMDYAVSEHKVRARVADALLAGVDGVVGLV